MKSIVYTIIGLISIVSTAAEEEKVNLIAGVFSSTEKMPLIVISIVFSIFFLYFFFSFLKRFKHHMTIKKQKDAVQAVQKKASHPLQQPVQQVQASVQQPAVQPIQQQTPINQIKNMILKKKTTNKMHHLKKVVEKHKEKQDVFYKLRNSF